MALIFLDGADHIDTLYKYANNGNASHGTPGRYGNGGFLQFNNGAMVLRRDIAAADTSATITVGFAYRFSIQQSTTLAIVNFLSNAAATQHVGFYFSAITGTATILAYRGTTAGTLLGTSSSFTMVDDIWTYLEFRVVLSDTVGTISIYKDGVSILALTGLDTKNGGAEAVFSSIGWEQSGSNGEAAIDDIYINTTSMLGELVIETLYPDGNGTYSDLLGSDGNSVNNYQLVNETTTSDANYVGSATPAQKDTYAMGALTRNDGTIVGVMTNHRLTKTDAGAISARRVLISDATINNGADITLTGSYVFTTAILEANPVSTDAWTIADIDDLEVGIEVRA